MKGSEVRSRCVPVRDDVFAPTPSPLSVRGLLLYAAWFDIRVETEDLVCAFMQTLDLRKDKNVMDGSGGYMGR